PTLPAVQPETPIRGPMPPELDKVRAISMPWTVLLASASRQDGSRRPAMDAAGRMRIARRKAGLSQAKLAAALGVQRSAVGHWESVDGKNPTMADLRAVAVATQVQFEWLATGRGEMQ